MTSGTIGPSLTMYQARQLEAVHRVVMGGLITAAQQLSLFVKQSIAIEMPRLGLCNVEQLSDCTLGTAFDEAPHCEAEAIKTSIYLRMTGHVEGHFLMMLAPDDARTLVAPLLQDLEVSPAEREAIVTSALGEAGNITLCAVLKALADATGLSIQPSCPSVVTDMAGAILQLPMADIAQVADEALYIEANITMEHATTTCALVLVPRPEGLEVLIERLMGAKKRRRRS